MNRHGTVTPMSDTAVSAAPPADRSPIEARVDQAADNDPLLDAPVVPVRHLGRWIATAGVLVLLAQVAHGLVTNAGWDWATFGRYFTERTVLNALAMTLRLTVLATVLGFLGGLALAGMRLSRSPLLQAVSWGYVWIFRSIPLIVQVLLWGNISYLYDRLGIGIPFGPVIAGAETHDLIGPITAAVIGLTLHQAAFSAEIIRSGFLSIDHGQLEAAAALGIGRWRQFHRILLPQAMRSILPNAANQIIDLIKSTSVVYVLAIGELFYQVQVIYGRNSRVVPLLMVATVWYIVLTTVLSIPQYYIERHYAQGSVRTLPPTPLQRIRRRLDSIRTEVAR